jgi:hypothetical protein
MIMLLGITSVFLLIGATYVKRHLRRRKCDIEELSRSIDTELTDRIIPFIQNYSRHDYETLWEIIGGKSGITQMRETVSAVIIFTRAIAAQDPSSRPACEELLSYALYFKLLTFLCLGEHLLHAFLPWLPRVLAVAMSRVYCETLIAYDDQRLAYILHDAV